MDIALYADCFSFFAIALTHNNVLKELKEVDWKTLCNNSIEHKTFSGILDLPESQGERIERMYVSEEERKSEGVSFWVNNHPYASWRLLIVEFDEKQQHSVANQIHQYAEKVTGKQYMYLVTTLVAIQFYSLFP